MVTERAESYALRRGDQVTLTGFSGTYHAFDVGPCPRSPTCGIPAILIRLPNPPHPVWAWVAKKLGLPIEATRLTWVHAVGVRPAQRENVEKDVEPDENAVEHD